MDCNTQTQIPRLLQLSAERVASMVNRYMEVLKHMHLPKVDITYVDYIGDANANVLVYQKCDFSKFIRKKHRKAAIVPSVPKWSENNEFTITIGDEKVLYISTIADLGINMLKLDFPAGEYGLFPFDDGYVLKMSDYSPRIRDAIHVFNTRDGDKGLAGTYEDGETENVNHLRIFNQFIGGYMKRFCEDRGKYQYRVVQTSLGAYSNIPVLFYLTKNINVNDLSKITLTCPSVINNCGNINVCWYVFHSENGRIGIAVLQNEFFKMMGAQAGLCLFASNGFRAVGNFDSDGPYTPADNVNRSVLQPRHYYECEFNPCSCDFSYNSSIERQFYSGMLSPQARDSVRNEIISRSMSLGQKYISQERMCNIC